MTHTIDSEAIAAAVQRRAARQLAGRLACLRSVPHGEFDPHQRAIRNCLRDLRRFEAPDEA